MITTEMAAALERGADGGVTLTVLYDRRCPLCRRLKDWLSRQPTLTQVEFLAADSDEAWNRFPELDHERSTRILTVVSSDGGVYEAERAWLVCAWTLPAWRGAAEHFATPLRRRVVRVGGQFVDAYRHRRVASEDECCSVMQVAP